MYYIYYLLHYFYLLFTVNLVCCRTAATAYAARRRPRVVLYNDLKHLNQALVLLQYYKNSPPISKSWIRAWCSQVFRAEKRNEHA